MIIGLIAIAIALLSLAMNLVTITLLEREVKKTNSSFFLVARNLTRITKLTTALFKQQNDLNCKMLESESRDTEEKLQ